MNTPFLHPSQYAKDRHRTVPGELIEAAAEVTVEPACCCPARPAVRVLMPPSATRRHPTELLLCGHHYRVSSQALATAHATVTELPGAAATALLPGLPQLSVPVA